MNDNNDRVAHISEEYKGSEDYEEQLSGWAKVK